MVRVIGELAEDAAEPEYSEVYCDEYSLADSLDVNNVKLTHFRSWNKYTYDSVFCLGYSLTSNAVEPSYEFRNNLYTLERNYEKYWRDIYYELYQTDREKISFLKDSLEQIARTNSLEKNELAKLIVSFVQDIPYSYVTPGPCEQLDRPCRGNEKFGILSPVEFLYSLTGDCDTRAVLIYTLLKHFDLNSLIVISNEYRHAMIAMDIPATGDYLIYKGKKFYFWETTNVGWLPGMLPPDVNNPAYWKITLDHEYTPDPASHR